MVLSANSAEGLELHEQGAKVAVRNLDDPETYRHQRENFQILSRPRPPCAASGNAVTRDKAAPLTFPARMNSSAACSKAFTSAATGHCAMSG